MTLILDINVMFKVISERKDSCSLHFRSQNMGFPLKNQFDIEMTLIIDLKVKVKDISGRKIECSFYFRSQNMRFSFKKINVTLK